MLQHAAGCVVADRRPRSPRSQDCEFDNDVSACFADLNEEKEKIPNR